jgi:hypothetical protein
MDTTNIREAVREKYGDAARSRTSRSPTIPSM